MAGTATVTILFTDLVGSTALLQLGADVADRLRREHIHAVRLSVTRHRGVEVKGTGDGLMTTFASAADALDAAVDIQRAVHRLQRDDPRHPSVRVGISTGEAVQEDNDWYGAPVVEAARLVDASQSGAGEIVATALVAALVGNRGGHRFGPIEARSVKGFDDPVDVVSVAWEPTATTTLIPLPPSVAALAKGPLAGRDGALATIDEAWRHAVEGRPQLVLVAGEPGIGKTHLVARWAAGHADEALILWGHCEEDLDQSFNSIGEALQSWRDHDADGLSALMRRPLEPLLASHADGPGPSSAASGGVGGLQAARNELFDAVSGLLADRAASGPVVLVVDDLHWAGAATLQLLRHLVAALHGTPVMVVATYRDTELSRSHPLSATLGELRRLIDPVQLRLHGLAAHDLTDLVAATTGGDAVSLAQRVQEQTAGNPFFVNQVLRHLAERAEADGDGADHTRDLPEGVREVVGLRLSRLPDAADRLLTGAAVIGARFDLDVLEAIGGGEASDDPLDLLDHAVRAGLISEVAERPGRFAFVHALVRQTLLSELTAARRARLHRAVAEALVARAGGNPADDDVVAIAHHFAACAMAGTIDGAIEWGLRAHAVLYARLAMDEDLALLDRCLQILELDPTERPDLRARINVARANAFAGSANPPEMKQAAAEAAADARLAGDVAVFVEAAGLRVAWNDGRVDPLGQALVDEALDMVDDRDPVARLRLRAARAMARGMTGVGPSDAIADLEDALAHAGEGLGPSELLVPRINQLLLYLGTPDLEGYRRAIDGAQQLLDHGHPADPGGMSALASLVADARVVEALRVGERDKALDLLDGAVAAGHLSDADHQPEHLPLMRLGSMLRAGLALASGDLKASKHHNRIYGATAPPDGTSAASVSAQGFRIMRSERGAGELVELLDSVTGSGVESGVAEDGVSAALGLALLDRGAPGDRDRAGDIVSRLVDDDLAAVSRHSTWSSVLADLSEIAAVTGDADAARVLRRHLEPFAGQVIVMAWGIALLGAADCYLGLLDATVGDVEQGAARLRRGIELEQVATPALVGRSQEWLRRVEGAAPGPAGVRSR